jgi:hypothetical protein
MDFGSIDGTGSLNAGAVPTYPTVAQVDAWIGLNATLFRFPVLWNYLQPSYTEDIGSSNATFDTLQQLINHVTDNGANQSSYAILDVVSNGFALLSSLIGSFPFRQDVFLTAT